MQTTELFQASKNVMTSAPVLDFPNFAKPFTLEIDASGGSGIEAVMSPYSLFCKQKNIT